MNTFEAEAEYGRIWAEIHAASDRRPLHDESKRKTASAKDKVKACLKRGIVTSGAIADETNIGQTRVCLALKRMVDGGEIRVAGMLKQKNSRKSRIYEAIK